MKKIMGLLLAAVLGIVTAGGISAQEKRGYIKPTFGFGFAVLEDYSGVAMSLDLDFVNSFGLTLGLQDLFVWNSDYVANPVAFGIGYTYNSEKWCAGAKLMAVPVEPANVGGIGFDINGTYWVMENLGVTGLMDLYFPEDHITFSMRAGVSLRF
jgi:hypothetical protein